MSSHQLSNYLRSYRKRTGLSQDDVAFLMGVESGAKVCRYERFARVPNLRTAFAYEVIFDTPASELFGGCYQQIEKQVTQRAIRLLRRITKNRSIHGESKNARFLLSMVPDSRPTKAH